MELREFAERVLFSPSLEVKLASPGTLTDVSPGTVPALPAVPARSPRMSLSSEHAVERFPTPGELERGERREQAIHVFANHELMALEIMAMTLLKFPDASKEWRRVVASTMVDEQIHAQLYLDRLNALGVGFGDFQLSDSFWRASGLITTPTRYDVIVGLTLEQANLDFAEHYRRLFRTIEDEETAVVLDRVYEDEVNHVRRGLHFFQQSVPEGESLFKAYQAALPEGLTAVRAKGPLFDEEGRRRAGLPQEYVDELRVYSRSKCRPSVVFAFNPVDDLEPLSSDFDALPTFLAQKEDIVLVRQRPRVEWLTQVKAAGFALPEYIVADPTQPLPEEVTSRQLGALAPWRWTPTMGQWMTPLASQNALSKLGPADVAEFESPEFVRAQLDSFILGQEEDLDWVLQKNEGSSEILRLSQSFRVSDDGVHLLGCRQSFQSDGTTGVLLGNFDTFLSPALLRFLHGGGQSPRRGRRFIQGWAKHLGAALLARGYQGPAVVDVSIVSVNGIFRLDPFGRLRVQTTIDHVASALERRLAQPSAGAWVCQRAESTEGETSVTERLAERIPYQERNGLIHQGVVPTNDPIVATEAQGYLLVVPGVDELGGVLRGLGVTFGIV